MRIEAKHIERQLEKQMEGVNNLEFNTVVQHFSNFAVSMLKIKLISESDLSHTVDAVQSHLPVTELTDMLANLSYIFFVNRILDC